MMSYAKEFFLQHGLSPDTLDKVHSIDDLKPEFELLLASYVAQEKDTYEFFDMVRRELSNITLRLDELEKATKKHERAKKRGLKLR